MSLNIKNSISVDGVLKNHPMIRKTRAGEVVTVLELDIKSEFATDDAKLLQVTKHCKVIVINQAIDILKESSYMVYRQAAKPGSHLLIHGQILPVERECTDEHNVAHTEVEMLILADSIARIGTDDEKITFS